MKRRQMKDFKPLQLDLNLSQEAVRVYAEHSLGCFVLNRF